MIALIKSADRAIGVASDAIADNALTILIVCAALVFLRGNIVDLYEWGMGSAQWVMSLF